MKLEEEGRTLRHLPLSEGGVFVGVGMHLAGLAMLMTSTRIGLSLALLSLGAGLAAVSGFYWGCRNNACS